MITTIIFLVISVLLNVLLVWYIIQLIKKLVYISENIDGLFETLKEYSEHIEEIYNMETYYGDSVLENLLTHSKNIVKEIKTYDELKALFSEEEEEHGEKEKI